jgi:hypothetical protein
VEKRQANSDARNILRTALAGLQAARAALGEAEQVAGRAEEDLGHATNSLKAYDGLDEQFAKARIEALRKGKWTGYPAKLQTKQRERSAAVEEERHAKHAFDILKGQADDARANVAIAEREVEEAAAVAFCEQVHDVVRQLNEANRQRDYLHQVLRGACLPFGSPGWERLLPDQRSNIMVNTIRGAGLPTGTLQPWKELDAAASTAVFARPSGEVNPDATAYWQTFAQAIKSDADAQAGPLPSPDSVLSAK